MFRFRLVAALVLFQLAQTQAQELRLAFQKEHDQTLTLSVVNRVASNGHTFIEFSTNGVWYPAYFISSNSIAASVFTVTNTGAVKMFRAVQAATIANHVKASWDRLGVTNYVFTYRQECLCRSFVSGTVTVMGDRVVKVDDARDSSGEPVENPHLPWAPTINKIFDRWLSSEPSGGYARKLEFDVNGFPRRFDIDRWPQGADEEETYSIYSFRPLP